MSGRLKDVNGRKRSKVKLLQQIRDAARAAKKAKLFSHDIDHSRVL